VSRYSLTQLVLRREESQENTRSYFLLSFDYLSLFMTKNKNTFTCLIFKLKKRISGFCHTHLFLSKVIEFNALVSAQYGKNL
jgi:hypothetical protein